MAETFLISDTHFNHVEILKFIGKNGLLMRGNSFSSIKEMNECIYDNWNDIVHPHDTIYHLGDVVVNIDQEFVTTFKKLNGKKILIAGNRDDIRFLMKEDLFQSIRLCQGFEEDKGMILTHIPIHEKICDSWKAKTRLINIHGHLHTEKSPSKFHRNVCVEWTEYKPIHIDEAKNLNSF